MHGIFTYIWLIFMVNVGIYTVRPMDPMGNVHLDMERPDFFPQRSGYELPRGEGTGRKG